MRHNETYYHIDRIGDYLSALRREFPAMTVGEMIGNADRAVLERKYAELLMLSQQLLHASNYLLREVWSE